MFSLIRESFFEFMIELSNSYLFISIYINRTTKLKKTIINNKYEFIINFKLHLHNYLPNVKLNCTFKKTYQKYFLQQSY